MYTIIQLPVKKNPGEPATVFIDSRHLYGANKRRLAVREQGTSITSGCVNPAIILARISTGFFWVVSRVVRHIKATGAYTESIRIGPERRQQLISFPPKQESN